MRIARPKTTVALALTVLCAVIYFAVPWLDSVNGFLSPEGRRVLERADTLELVGINPLLASESWEVGKVSITDSALRKQILDQLFDDIRNGDEPAMCFNPHHLIRARHDGKEIELIICFQCSVIKSRRGDRVKWTPIARSSERHLDRILFEAGVWKKLPEYDEEDYEVVR